MATNPDRESYFPAIERKHGLPMAYWFEQMDLVKDQKYPEQMAFLQENHGFSRTHANALVLYCRGNTTSRRFTSLDEYLAESDDVKRATVHAIFGAIQSKYPRLELVIAWNQPMLKQGTQYVFGLNVLSKHILLAPVSTAVLDEFRPRLAGYKVNKKTIQVPVDWSVDRKLLRDLVAARLAEITASGKP